MTPLRHAAMGCCTLDTISVVAADKDHVGAYRPSSINTVG